MNGDTIKKLAVKVAKHKSAQNFLIIGIIAVIQLVNNTILGRELSQEEFGVYSFVFLNITRLLSVLLIFGQGATILRFFSSRNIEEYRWKKYLFTILIIIIVPLIGISLGIKFFYGLQWFWFTMIITGSFILCISMLLASLFRSRGSFNTAVILERAHPLFFLLLLIVPFFVFKSIKLNESAILKLLSFSIIVPFFMFVLFKWKEGVKEIKKEVIFEGLALWELSITVVVLTQLDAFFIFKMLTPKDLALYNIIVLVLQVYEFSRASLFNIYSQKFSRASEINIGKFFKLLLAIIVLLGAFYLAGTNVILTILFDNKYTAPLLLIFLFCVYYSLNLLYVLPSCYLIGQSKKKEIRIMLVINVIAIVLKVTLIFVFFELGLAGFLIAGIISQGFRTAGGYFLVFKK